ncbi:hypothetical protein [Lysinibacillus sp. SGAir0095]|uniref:hypothetical protein n=1 Tax=Lysinibacillus sp. SGAir0095 TaxID=2070463 RepID=UPI0010CD46F7|nr:hypothetical protein [Lysinibacillus sp. SGAir0095]QCR31824.1 hypothetical protein C1N55_06375 [Lysinibacillus sp. SGAir0095]
MVVGIVIILIISQLICFYFIVILNTKIAKFKDLEKRQDQLIREMDDAISLYLVEMKEENDRLINELSSIKQNESKNNEIKNQILARINSEDSQRLSSTAQDESASKMDPVESIPPKALVPKKVATNAYKQQTVNEVRPVKQTIETETVEKDLTVLPSFEQKVITLYQQGKTIDEIAKLTQKGKTEIELLIKFHA